MLEWTDVWKVLLGFVSSLLLIWIKELFVHRRRLVGMRKSLWSMLEFESDLGEFVGALDRMKVSVGDGNLMLVAFNVPRGITTAAAELAKLEPNSAYVYTDLQSRAEIVRNGIASLQGFVGDLVTAGSGSDDQDRIRNAIIGQASILKGDRLDFGQAEVRVLKHIKKHQRKMNQSTLDRMETALAKFQKDDYGNLFREESK